MKLPCIFKRYNHCYLDNFANLTLVSWSATSKTRVNEIWCKSINFKKFGDDIRFWALHWIYLILATSYTNFSEEFIINNWRRKRPDRSLIYIFICFFFWTLDFSLVSGSHVQPPYCIFQRPTRHLKVDALRFKMSPWYIFLVASNFDHSSDPIVVDRPIYKFQKTIYRLFSFYISSQSVVLCMLVAG